MEQDYIKESLKIKEFLEEMLLNKKNHEEEFKSAKSGFPRSFGETYSSFAKTDGGWLIFGITPISQPISHKIIRHKLSDYTKRENSKALAAIELAFDIQLTYSKVTDYFSNKMVYLSCLNTSILAKRLQITIQNNIPQIRL